MVAGVVMADWRAGEATPLQGVQNGGMSSKSSPQCRFWGVVIRLEMPCSPHGSIASPSSSSCSAVITPLGSRTPAMKRRLTGRIKDPPLEAMVRVAFMRASQHWASRASGAGVEAAEVSLGLLTLGQVAGRCFLKAGGEAEVMGYKRHANGTPNTWEMA